MIEYFAESGNCLQCCLAGLFNRELEEVPGIMDFDKDAKDRFSGYWFDSFYDWCVTTIGHVPVVFAEKELDDTLDDIIHLEVRETDSGITHCAVARGPDILWDPSFVAEKERKILYRIVFVPLQHEGGIDHKWTPTHVNSGS